MCTFGIFSLTPRLTCLPFDILLNASIVASAKSILFAAFIVPYQEASRISKAPLLLFYVISSVPDLGSVQFSFSKHHAFVFMELRCIFAVVSSFQLFPNSHMQCQGWFPEG